MVNIENLLQKSMTFLLEALLATHIRSYCWGILLLT